MDSVKTRAGYDKDTTSKTMSLPNAPAYEIDRPSGRCAFTNEEIAAGDLYYATLIALSAEQTAEMNRERAKNGRKLNLLGLTRVDVSESAWSRGLRPDSLFSYWRAVQPEPGVKKKVFVDDTTLMALLQRMESETDPDRIAFRYVLALILLRKKLLRYDRVEDFTAEASDEHVDIDPDTAKWWVLTPKADVNKGPMGRWADATLRVLNPGLDEARIEEVAEQIGEVMDGMDD